MMCTNLDGVLMGREGAVTQSVLNTNTQGEEIGELEPTIEI